ncbi:mechanosensitive ion channel family protein [Aestuariibaculum suncheonense]|uniref:Mechanosensitive ion channel n=1 Tax=Aestuariibaculum suncheonense TaxID=1028745 RepID=A0A8J6QVM9_9FLAO|nr:mechanosensitive ion channel domain-containing protein [Aestuariibaculum suncheonense]MBD0835869.1 mechanosensitive ion channel [Aestuariibaculum suncheonense]
MDKLTEWNDNVMNSLSTMTNEVAKVVPNILGALAVLIIGWLSIKLIVFVVRRGLKFAKADKLDDKLNEIQFLGNSSLNFDVINIITKFVKWVMYLIIIIVITDILNLTIVSEEIRNFLRYIPQLFSALIIFTIGLLLANFIKKGIQSFFDSMDMSGSKFISQVVFLVLLVFISITALNQAGVDTEIITSNITMILAAFLLAFAIAFGLGAQRVVNDLLRAFYARKTYEIGQIIEFNDIKGEVERIDNTSITIKTLSGKLVIPIKDIVESQVRIRE